MESSVNTTDAAGSRTPDVDMLVVGAGFGGLRLIHEARQRGLSVRVCETGTNVGGTWYWNRYPGARTDSESWVYCFSFDKDLLQEWNWSERFPPQAETEAYLRHAAERFDMLDNIQFRTRVTSAVYDERTNLWTVSTDAGDVITCRFFVTATGLITVPKEPPFPGLDKFQGAWYQTPRWPKEPVDLVGKRVVVVGTGASGIQVIPVVAQSASQVTVMQRTPSYSIPGRNFPLTDVHRAEIKRNYDAIWEQARHQAFAFPIETPNRFWDDVTPEEAQRVFEAGWESGGFRFIFETFDDILTTQECNDAASEFVRNKIRTIVKDPETAELLCPKNHPLGGKRIPLGHFYYESFNRDNVSLVDVKANPISEITPTGIRLQDGEEYEADVIVFAIGFDVVTGAITNIDVRGRGDVALKQRWADQRPQTYLGLCEADFPNMFMLSGPQSTYGNLPTVLDAQTRFIGRAIEFMHNGGHDRIEVTSDAARAWAEHCEAIQNATVIPQGAAAGSYLVGADSPGKANVLWHFGGAHKFFDEMDEVADQGFKTFVFEDVRDASDSAPHV
jgi:cyclohexanone monooxygenase